MSGQLRTVLRGLSKEFELSDTDRIGEAYLHLESLRVFDAQALANPYLVGIPSLTALWGLVHKYERSFQKLSGQDVRFNGVSWFLRSYSASGGVRLPEPSVLKRNSQNVVRPGIIDSKLCDLVMDLVIRVSIPDGGAFADHVDSTLKAALPSAFAGGVLHPPSLYEKRDWMMLHSSPSKLFRKLACLPRNGCWVCPSASDSTSLEGVLERVDVMPY